VIGFLLALLLWMVGAGPTPTPSVDAVHAVSAPASVVPPAHRAPRSETHQPPAAVPTVAAPPPPLATPAPDDGCPMHPQMSDDPAYAACPTDPGEVGP
jgi:hypothetical protein